MAVTVPNRDDDQVKITGAKIPKIVENRENMDGGPNDADHAAKQDNPGRIHDHGISDADFVNISPQRVTVGKSHRIAAGGPSSLVFHRPFAGTFVSEVGRKREPVASIVETPDAGHNFSDSFDLDGSGSVGGSGADGIPNTITSFLWSIVGPFIIIFGTTTTPSLKLMDITFSSGAFVQSLTVTDADGKTGTVTETVDTISV